MPQRYPFELGVVCKGKTPRELIPSFLKELRKQCLRYTPVDKMTQEFLWQSRELADFVSKRAQCARYYEREESAEDRIFLENRLKAFSPAYTQFRALPGDPGHWAWIPDKKRLDSLSEPLRVVHSTPEALAAALAYAKEHGTCYIYREEEQELTLLEVSPQQIVQATTIWRKTR